MTNYILIDGSYFIFYRIFALHVWWRNANPEIKLENPFQNEEFVEKYKSTFNEQDYEACKWLTGC